MKLLVVVLVVAVAMVSTSAATSKFRRQILSDVDTKTIPAILKNKAAVETHVSCVVSDDQKALEICDKVGKKLRDSARGAIEKGDCPTACTAEEKQIIANILVTVRDKYPDQWKRVTDHFKPTPEQTTKFEEFLKQGKAYE